VIKATNVAWPFDTPSRSSAVGHDDYDDYDSFDGNKLIAVTCQISAPISDHMGSLSSAAASVIAIDQESSEVTFALPTGQNCTQQKDQVQEIYASEAAKSFVTVVSEAEASAGRMYHVRGKLLEIGPQALVAEATFVIGTEWDDWSVLNTPKFAAYWEQKQTQLVREGVSWSDGAVSSSLVCSLTQNINRLAASEPVDYHPNSNNVVRDHVHPALYPYIQGVTQTTSLPAQTTGTSGRGEWVERGEEVAHIDEFFPGWRDQFLPGIEEGQLLDRLHSMESDLHSIDEGADKRESLSFLIDYTRFCIAQLKDMFGRKYETSIYQWLPTQFDISATGKCTINGHINNLDKTKHNLLYKDLESLFSCFLPHLECVHSYIKDTYNGKHGFILEERPFDIKYPMGNLVEPQRMDFSRHTLHSRSLQVVTKIVDYELGAGEQYEGVWHVEGMSHENIVATCLYVLDRGENIEGGELQFKRAFLQHESTALTCGMGQDWPRVTYEKVVTNGMVPLGQIHTPQGRMLVFPNSHVHKVSTMINTALEEETLLNAGAVGTAEADGSSDQIDQIRRIICFFVINPEREIISTRHVPEPQQLTMQHEEALAHRLALMKERRHHKQDWNIREVSLCEH
jgi:hypothetical protein